MKENVESLVVKDLIKPGMSKEDALAAFVNCKFTHHQVEEFCELYQKMYGSMPDPGVMADRRVVDYAVPKS